PRRLAVLTRWAGLEQLVDVDPTALRREVRAVHGGESLTTLAVVVDVLDRWSLLADHDDERPGALAVAVPGERALGDRVRPRYRHVRQVHHPCPHLAGVGVERR